MKRVLWITPSILPSSGGQAMHSLGYIRALSKVCELKVIARATLGELKQVESDSSMFQGLDVTLVRAYKFNSKFNKVRQPISKWISHNSGVMVPYRNIANTIKNVVKNFEPDIVVIDYIGMYNYYTLTKKMCPHARFVYVSHNVEFKNFTDIKTSAEKKSFASNFWIEKRKKYEERMLCESDASLCISNSDIDIFKAEFPKTKKLVFAKPLIKFAKIKSKEDLRKFGKKLLVVGSMDWYPNVNGIEWFVEDVFIPLAKSDPEYKLYLVGRKPDDRIKKLGEKCENIIVTGSVDSVDPYYKECDVSIIPVFEGTGAKIKVLESLGKGIPTVCSDFAAKDYLLNNGEMMVVPQNAKAFESAINKLKSSLETRMAIYDKMEQYMENYYEINPEIVKLFE
ncbi:MAG: glycosyltransferase family 4 protein [Lachnospiraceae bacterium]|nr:glycosyltransferase family 4 protein [Lachnospiraceae bacterium]